MKRLKNKTVVISGASSGIGKSMAEAFAAEQCNLVLGARRVEKLEKLAKALRKKFRVKVQVAELDVTLTESVNRFVKSAHEEFGSLDILINNAGLALGVETIAEGHEEDWTRVIDTNVMGVLRMTRATLPYLLKQKSGGHVINLGSVAGHFVYEGGSVYCASKHALRAITETLRLEVNGKPIRVSSIDPGMVETEFSKVRFKGDAKRAAGVYQGMTPLTPDDIAETAVFIAGRPPHVNIDKLIINPTDQAGLKVSRKT